MEGMSGSFLETPYLIYSILQLGKPVSHDGGRFKACQSCPYATSYFMDKAEDEPALVEVRRVWHCEPVTAGPTSCLSPSGCLHAPDPGK